MDTMKTILVAVDFSDVTDAVVKAAEAQALASHAVVNIVHVSLSEPNYVGYGATPVYNVDVVEKKVENETKKLESIATGLREKGIEARSELLEGPISDTLMTEFDKGDYDMIIMGSHGHGALFNLVVGSVTNALLHHAKVPVLVVPSSPKKK